MASRVVRARLREEIDDDIAQALDSLPKSMGESDVLRAALRLYFGIGEQQTINQPKIKQQYLPSVPVLAKKDPEIIKDSAQALDDLFGKY